MPVSTSCEQQRNSDLQVNENILKIAEKISKRPLTKAKNENHETIHRELIDSGFSHSRNSINKLNLFRVRKGISDKRRPPKVLGEKNWEESLELTPVHRAGLPDHHRTSEDVVVRPKHKRKLFGNVTSLFDASDEVSSGRHKLKKLSTATIEQPTFKMYEYHHPMTSPTKNEGDTTYTIRISEENLLNAFYQNQGLGGSNNSIATLCNIGNSCYLNSVIYTLRFAPHFLHKLHHLVEDMRQVYLRIGQHKLKSSSLGRNVSGLQGHNGRSWSSKDLVSLNGISSNGIDPVSKCNRQIATEKLHELYQSLHRNESIDSAESFHAGTFLQAIQDVSSVFEGNQQQDAHELLMSILDSIRETCSTLIKTIKEYPEIMNQNVPASEPNELTSPPQSNVHSAQSLKSIFSRKIKRKDTLKNSGGTSSPIKENIAENPIAEDEQQQQQQNNDTSRTNSEASSAESSDKVNEAIKRLGLDFFCKDFEGITLFTTKCLTCETVTEQKETMVDIAIPISHENLTQPIDPQLFFQVN